jgi:hypothetical protein
MREMQALVKDAVLSLLGGSYPEDEFFVIHFNAKAYLDQNFTSDKDQLHDAVNKTGHRGQGAMRDAVGDAIDYATKHGKQKVTELLVITDPPTATRGSFQPVPTATTLASGSTGLLGCVVRRVSTQSRNVLFCAK